MNSFHQPASASSPITPHVFRPGKSAWYILGGSLVYVLFTAFWMTCIGSHGANNQTFILLAAGMLITCGITSFFFSPARVALSVDADGFTYKAYIGSQRFNWAEIESISRNPRRPAYFQLTLRNRRAVTIPDYFKPNGLELGAYLAQQCALAGTPVTAPAPLTRGTKLKFYLTFCGVILLLVLRFALRLPAVRQALAGILANH